MKRICAKLSAGLAIAFLAASAAWAADEPAARPDVRIPAVSVATADVTEIVSRIPVSGTLAPREEVLINPQINGYAIEKINVDVGDAISAGDVLAVLDDSALRAQLTQAEAELSRANAAVRQAQSQIDSAKAAMDEAEATLERTRTLRGSGNVSQATMNQNLAAAATARAAFASAQDGLDVAKAQVLQAMSQRDVAALNLARAKIKSSVAGIVSARNAKLGAIAASGGDPMFRIIRDGEIEIEAEVIETALGSVAMGDLVEATIAGNFTAVGTVRLIAPTVDPVTRLGIIRIALEHDGPFRPGTFASAWIVTDRHDATTVPSTAVLNDLQGTFVLVVKDGVVDKRRVMAGLLSEDGRREIVKGIEVGETLILRAGAFFRDGDRVVAAEPDDRIEGADAQ